MPKEHKPIIRANEEDQKGNSCVVRMSILIVTNKSTFGNPQFNQDVKLLAHNHNGVLMLSNPLLAWSEQELKDELRRRKKGTSATSRLVP